MTKLIYSAVLALALFCSLTAKAQPGSSFNEPIITGNLNQNGSFFDTQYNETPNSLGESWIPGDNIYYSFTLDSYTEVAISNCGSSLDTYLELMDEWGSYLYSNDDNGPQCAGSQASIQIYLAPGTYVFSTRANDFENWGYINTSISTAAPCTNFDGATQSTAINAGSFSASGSFSDTRMNNHCMGNDTGTESNDIYYQFSLANKSMVSMSHCGSGFDTYMWLLNSSGTVMASNDDNYTATTPCPGLESFIQRELDPGTYYVVSEGYGSNSGNIVTNIQVSVVSGGTTPGDFQPLCSTLAASPSTDQNYILTYTPRIATTDDSNLNSLGICQVNQTIQYFDGLGRPLQTVQTKGSPSGNDLIQPVEYDTFGREVRKYLPYTEAGSGQYRSNAISSQAGFYNNGAANAVVVISPVDGITPSFAETRFESSPLSRVEEQGAPGTSWQLSGGHTLRSASLSNNNNDGVQRWTVNSSGASTAGNFHGVNQLYKNIIKDENWTANQTYPQASTTEEFSNKEGKLVLKRTFNHNTSNNTLETLSTYYVYDDYNNLRYVIPPAVTVTSFTDGDTWFNQYIYAYQYDNRNRVVKKKIPGKGWEEMMYNTLDQVVLTRDAIQAASGKWLFAKYDAFGRVISTGIFSTWADRATLQGQIDAAARYEIRNGAADYPGNAFPTSGAEYLTVNYYDDYFFNGASSYPFVSFSSDPLWSQSNKTKGLLTGSKVTVLGGSQFLYTVAYYNEDGRLIQTHVQNHLNGVDRTDNKYSFTGELTQSTRTHSSSTAGVTIANRYIYDHAGRKKQTFQATGAAGAAEVLVSEMYYNAIGQLKDKKLHNNLYNIAYTYNARGWLKSQNSTHFAMSLSYDDHSDVAKRQYNGNVSGQHWGTSANPFLHNYFYIYNNLNRLTQGISDEGFNEVLNFDVMGNITNLSRNPLGSMSYQYNGNQLGSITGSGSYPSTSYTYDINGNMKTDAAKGITNIDYNYLNLPQSISTTSGQMNNTWLANGVKVKKTVGSLTRDYVGGIEYNNQSIEFIQTEEGRALPGGGSYFYEYALKDHLGNTRVLIDQNGSHKETSDYYPFGLQITRAGQMVTSPENRYKYNGKELQTELGLMQYDYGARFYDLVTSRWNVIDPKAELYLNSSPYVYVANNPLALIDPNGMEIFETNDGVKFTGSDAVGAFMLLTQKTRNAFLDIEGNKGVRDKTNNLNKTGFYGQWSIFSAPNLKLGLQALSAIGKVSRRQLNNLAIETHGNQDYGSSIRLNDNGKRGHENYINNKELNYIFGNVPEPYCSSMSAKALQLQNLADLVVNGGRLILAACNIGKGEEGRYFAGNLAKLTGNRLNIFLPTGFVNAAIGADVKTKQFIPWMDNTFRVDTNPGWIKITPTGAVQDVKGLHLNLEGGPPVN